MLNRKRNLIVAGLASLLVAGAALAQVPGVQTGVASIVFFTNVGDVALPITPPNASTGGGMQFNGVTAINGQGASGTPTSLIVTGGTSTGGTGGAARLHGGVAGATGTGGDATVRGGAGGATSGDGGLASLTGGAATAGNGNGGLAREVGGAGQGTGNGGAAQLTGGASGAGATGTGGAVASTGGASLATNGAGGAISQTGGAGAGTGNGGAASVTGGAAGATGVGGAATLAAGAATAGAGADVNVTASAGVGSTNAGGNVNLTAGAAASTGIPGKVKFNGDANLICSSYFFTGTPAATNQVFFIANRPLIMTSISEIHSTAAGGTSTLDVTKDTSTGAPASGSALGQAAFNLNATANTVQNATLNATIATIKLAAGDRLAVKFNNAIQSSVGVVVEACAAPI